MTYALRALSACFCAVENECHRPNPNPMHRRCDDDDDDIDIKMRRCGGRETTSKSKRSQQEVCWKKSET